MDISMLWSSFSFSFIFYNLAAIYYFAFHKITTGNIYFKMYGVKRLNLQLFFKGYLHKPSFPFFSAFFITKINMHNVCFIWSLFIWLHGENIWIHILNYFTVIKLAIVLKNMTLQKWCVVFSTVAAWQAVGNSSCFFISSFPRWHPLDRCRKTFQES